MNENLIMKVYTLVCEVLGVQCCHSKERYQEPNGLCFLFFPEFTNKEIGGGSSSEFRETARRTFGGNDSHVTENTAMSVVD